MNRGTIGVNSLPKTVRPTRQRRGCDLNPGPSVPESSTLTTRLSRGASQNFKAKTTRTLWGLYRSPCAATLAIVK